jgi:flagellar biosynthesis/type III secretory pathway chaperone
MPTLRTARRMKIKSPQNIKQDKLSKKAKLKIEEAERIIAKTRKPIITVYKLHDNIKELIIEINSLLKFKKLSNSTLLNEKLFQALEIADIVQAYKDPVVYKYLDSAEKAGLRIMAEDYKELSKRIKEIHMKKPK